MTRRVNKLIESMKPNYELLDPENFGMPMPEGYRKALRLMKQAEKFNRPIVCFVNTPGAYPGMDAEERGMGESIARNLLEMAKLTVPVLCILVGEGGSGGARDGLKGSSEACLQIYC